MIIRKLDEDVYDDIANNLGDDFTDGAKKATISAMSPDEAWMRYCIWNGLLGNFHQQLANAYENIKKAKNR